MRTKTITEHQLLKADVQAQEAISNISPRLYNRRRKIFTAKFLEEIEKRSKERNISYTRYYEHLVLEKRPNIPNHHYTVEHITIKKFASNKIKTTQGYLVTVV